MAPPSPITTCTPPSPITTCTSLTVQLLSRLDYVLAQIQDSSALLKTIESKRLELDHYNRKMDEWFEQKRKVIWEF